MIGGDKHGQRKSLRKQSSLSAERKIKKALGGIPKSDFYSGYCVHCNNSDIPFISKLDITETMIGRKRRMSRKEKPMINNTNSIITEQEKVTEAKLAERLSRLTDKEISVVVGLIDGMLLAKQINTPA